VSLNIRDCELTVGFPVPLSSKTTVGFSVRGSHRHAGHCVANGYLVFVSGPTDLSAKMAGRVVEQREFAGP